FAVEEALRQKEKAGAGEVVVIALGPPAAQETIRTALAMGADRGVLLQTQGLHADGLETARALASELKDNGFDLILLGKMAIDDYNHQVGPMVAELLDLPCVTTVAHLEIAAGKATAEREIEGGVEVVEFSLPAVLTTDKGLNEPRYPALKGIMAARKQKFCEQRPRGPRAAGRRVAEGVARGGDRRPAARRRAEWQRGRADSGGGPGARRGPAGPVRRGQGDHAHERRVRHVCAGGLRGRHRRARHGRRVWSRGVRRQRDGEGPRAPSGRAAGAPAGAGHYRPRGRWWRGHADAARVRGEGPPEAQGRRDARGHLLEAECLHTGREIGRA